MEHVIQLPDELYHAVEVYAAQRQQTPQDAIFAWATDIQRQVAQTPTTAAGAAATSTTPFDPWSGFLTEATDPDVTIRHDFYLAEEAIDPHDPQSVRRS